MKTVFILASFLVLIACLTSSVSADNFCKAINLANGSKISFGTASQFAGTWPNKLTQNGDVNGEYVWSMSLCDPTVQAAGAPGCASGRYMAQDTNCDVAFSNPPTTSEYGQIGVMFSFAATTIGTLSWSSVVNCVCDGSADGIVIPTNSYQADVNNDAKTVSLTWNVNSKGCCIDNGGGGGGGDDGGDKSKGGITWGGVFLILFFVPLGLYVIGFVAWNYKQGKTGADLAPHPEFWKSLPSLAKDGITFIWSKIRGTSWSPSEGASATPGSSGEAGGYASV